MHRIVISDASEVLVLRGLPTAVLPDRKTRRRVALLTQPGARVVADRVRAHLEEGCTVVELPDRDEAKSLAVVADVFQQLAEFDLGREDTVIGVGGGAVTDVAGFVAATWLRGVESVHVPTTMLAAVDAAIGGKTGVNVGGKNLVGAFWHPSRVIVDLDVLDALPLELRLEGDAEALKAGLIADEEIVSEYERHGADAALDVIVPRAIAVKAGIVEEDFREAGRRAVLNFGHTIGHAVEVAAGLPHGFAVSVGMVAAGVISNARYGFDHRWLTDLLFSLGLPVAASGVSASACRRLIELDKKRTSEGIRMVLLRSLGDPVVETVSNEEIELGLRSIGAE